MAFISGCIHFHLQDAEGVLTTTSVSPATPDPLFKGPHTYPNQKGVFFVSHAFSEAFSNVIGEKQKRLLKRDPISI